MAVTTRSFTPFMADRVRVTRTDYCGKPVEGLRSYVVSDGIISVAFAFDVEDQVNVEVKNAAGALKVSTIGTPKTIKRVNLTATFTGVNPDIYEIMTGQQLVTDGQGTPVGVRIAESVPLTSGFGLETWSGGAFEDQDECAGGFRQYGYFLVPLLVGGQIGDIELNDGAMSCVVTGSSKRSTGWENGPYDVFDVSETDTPTAGPLLTEWGFTDLIQMNHTPIAPPPVTDGAQPLPVAP